MVIVMLGAPGAGKGTIAKRLSNELGIPHISTGDLIRAKVQENDPKKDEYQSIMDSGGLISDEDVSRIVEERLANDDTNEGLIFDGFPRNLSQTDLCDEVLAKFDKKVDLAINLDVATEIIIDRISNRRVCPNCNAVYNTKNLPPKVEGICDECGTEIVQRTDDSEEQVKARLDVYYDQTEPLIDYYRDKGQLFNLSIKEEREPGITVQEILDYLEEAK